AFPDILRGVAQSAVPDQKIQAAARQIQSVNSGYAAHRKLRGGGVLRPPPRPATHGYAGAGQAIDRGKRERFRLPVVPSQAPENTDVLSQPLFQVHAEAIFECAGAARCGNVGTGAGLLTQTDSLCVSAGGGVM